MNFRAHIIEKIRQFVAVYYQLNSNKADNLKALQRGWAFFNFNLDEVYILTKI